MIFKPEKISFRAVTQITRDGKTIEILYEMTKGVEDRIYFSLSLFNVSEAFIVLQYLRYNPCSFLSLEETSSEPSLRPGGSGGSSGGSSGSAARDGWDKEGVFDDLLIPVMPEVDTESGNIAIRNVLEARRMGYETLEMLKEQAEQMDRMHHTVKNLHANLDKSERILRGLSSFGGGLKNLMTRDRTRKNNPAFHFMERSIHLAEKVPDILEISILLKHPDDTLSPAVLSFQQEFFEVHEPGKPVNKLLCWPYSKVEQIVLRARPLHIDVRFSNELPRFRMLTSYTQGITNELFLRSVVVGHEPEIIFEPNIPEFDYGSYRLSLIRVTSIDRDPNNPFTAGSSQFVKKAQASDILVGVTQETRDAYDRQARQVEETSEICDELISLARAIGTEADASLHKIDGLSKDTIAATERVHRQNFNVKDIRG
ncbi:MAG: Qb-SNARE protein [archaeon]|nr:Qb-SNARE protein [archaeon]